MASAALEMTSMSAIRIPLIEGKSDFLIIEAPLNFALEFRKIFTSKYEFLMLFVSLIS